MVVDSPISYLVPVTLMATLLLAGYRTELLRGCDDVGTLLLSRGAVAARCCGTCPEAITPGETFPMQRCVWEWQKKALEIQNSMIHLRVVLVVIGYTAFCCLSHPTPRAGVSGSNSCGWATITLLNPTRPTIG